MKTLKLEKEGGITEGSRRNARRLIQQRGFPIIVKFRGTETTNHHVYFIWPGGLSFIFTGFAWGYGGTGPRGLYHTLLLIGMNPHRAKEIVNSSPALAPAYVYRWSDQDWDYVETVVDLMEEEQE